MNCLEFRRRIGAEPFASDAPADAHAAECKSCARHRDELRVLDGVLARAMAIDLTRLPPAKQKPAAGSGPSLPRRWLAMAASLVAGVLVAATLWVSYPAPSLAAEVIVHAMHEPESWSKNQPLAADTVEAVLAPDRIRLRPGSQKVTYARRCLFAGHWVPHLVVQTPAGAVTVLMLMHRDVDARMVVEEEGLVGVVLPAPRGSIAIVGRNVSGLDEIARQVFESVDWNA